MICCFGLDPNDIDGGEVMGFTVQGLTEPDKVVGKKCIAKLWEIDTLVGKRKETTPDDLLAEFETVIEKGSKKGDFFFNLDKTKRIDAFPANLPAPEYQNDPKGNKLPVPLNYKPPYFKVYFDSGAPRPKDSDLHIILIRSDENEIEAFNYEIGYSVELDGQMIFDGRKIVQYVVCVNILAENCKNAADFIIDNHDNLIKDRKCGTHYGNMFSYGFKNEADYLKEVARINPDAAEAKKGLWKDADKIMFDDQNHKYGLKMTSCIDFVLETMEIGFTKSLMTPEWNKIKNCISSKKSGQELAKGLTDVGWVALFYTPDSVHFYDLDYDGVHKSSFENAKKNHRYGHEGIKPIIPVFDFVINYSPTTYYEDGSIETNPIKQELDQVNKLKKVPFAFLFAKYGYHTAILTDGKVTEVHWVNGPDITGLFGKDKEFKFQPPSIGSGEDSLTWEWLSGLIVVPRMFWTKPAYTFSA